MLKDATVAIEDERFYKHKGVDYEGIVRAAVKNFLNRETVEGGSTLTMQLVKNLYTADRTREGLAGYQRKIREAKLAEELENEHSKEWILEKYLNTTPYGTVGGQTAIGAEAAARDLLQQARQAARPARGGAAGRPAAGAVGLLADPARAGRQAPPQRGAGQDGRARHGHPAAGRTRAMRRGLDLNPSDYFSRRRESYFFDYVKDELIKEYGAQTVKLGGLVVHTTIDLDKQRKAREAIATQLGDAGPSSALVTINPRNGYILAMASSGDYADSKFNLAAQGERQPGSSFKTMALMTALRNGVNPNTTRYTSVSPTRINDPRFGAPFEIKTYGGTSGGNMNLFQATLRSDNSVFIQLALDLGPENVADTAVDMGIKREHVHGYPAESLGGLEEGVSPLEMATAYGTIASGGYRNRPTAITKVEFPDRQVRAAAALARQAHEDLHRRPDLRGDQDPRGEHPGRHRHARRHRLPGGRQDRHHRPQHRRLVRRLHAAPGDRRLGRLSQRPHRDAHAVLRRAGRRRHVPGRHLGRLHEVDHGQLLRLLPAAEGGRSSRSRSSATTRAAAATSSASATETEESRASPSRTSPRSPRSSRRSRRRAAAPSSTPSSTSRRRRTRRPPRRREPLPRAPPRLV